MPTRRLAASCVTAGALVALAGCGGGHKAANPHSTRTTTPTTTRAAKPTPAAVPTTLSESVLRVIPARPFAASTRARTGNSLVFRTLLPPAIRSGSRVKFDVAQGPGQTLTVTARAKGQTSTATVISAAGKPVTLDLLHYQCALPPAPTFCPLRQVSAGAHSVSFQVIATAGVPIVFSATVGPLNLPASLAKAPGSLVVAPYTVTETVRALPRASKSKHPALTATPFAPSATVSPGQLVILDTIVRGQADGAPQPVTLNLDQGPGTAIKVTAGVPGGTTSTATLKSANRSPITLVAPRFFCNLPPQLTFCPPQHVATGFHRYTITFQASPVTPPILLYAVAEAG